MPSMPARSLHRWLSTSMPTGHVRMAACLACLTGASLVSPAAGQTQKISAAPLDPPPQTGRKRFVFDGEFFTNDGLTFSFSRPIITIDSAAQLIAADEPRYEP